MLENRKIQLQSRTIRRLHEENLRLAAENEELKEQIKSQALLAEAAEKYRTEHQKALAALAKAKDKYQQAAREAAAGKKKYLAKAKRA